MKNDENKKLTELPEFWIIQYYATDTRFQLVFDYFKEKYDEDWDEDVLRRYKYYGFDDSNNFNGTNAYDDIEDFGNNPTLITIDDFVRLTKSTVIKQDNFNLTELPKYWFIKTTTDNNDMVCNWFDKLYPDDPTDRTIGNYYGNEIGINYIKGRMYFCDPLTYFETEINTEQFIEWVLKNNDVDKIEDLKMNSLPKYWIIKYDKNDTRFQLVFDYLNTNYNESWSGKDSYRYYGFDGSDNFNGTYINSFINNPTLITIDDFIWLTKTTIIKEGNKRMFDDIIQKTEQSFWLLYIDKQPLLNTKFYNYHSAREEAEKLSIKNNNVEVTILKAVESIKPKPIMFDETKYVDDYLPF